ncbi:MAG: hypothetical protein Q4C71_00055 [Microbacteriaceae bacterium]|nr:hypothetical protein [Microbacteriaceae bacterium]
MPQHQPAEHTTSENTSAKPRKALLAILSMLIVLVLATNAAIFLIVSNTQNNEVASIDVNQPKRPPMWEDIEGEWKKADGTTMKVELDLKRYAPPVSNEPGCYGLGVYRSDLTMLYCPAGESTFKRSKNDDAMQRSVDESDKTKDRIWTHNINTNTIEGPYIRTSPDPRIIKEEPKSYKWENVEGNWERPDGKTNKVSLKDLEFGEPIGSCFRVKLVGIDGAIYYCPPGPMDELVNSLAPGTDKTHLIRTDRRKERIWYSVSNNFKEAYYRAGTAPKSTQNAEPTIQKSNNPNSGPKWADIEGNWHLPRGQAWSHKAGATLKVNFHDKSKFVFHDGNKTDGGCLQGTISTSSGAGGATVWYCPAGVPLPSRLQAENEDVSKERLLISHQVRDSPFYRN